MSQFWYTTFLCWWLLMIPVTKYKEVWNTQKMGNISCYTQGSGWSCTPSWKWLSLQGTSTSEYRCTPNWQSRFTIYCKGNLGLYKYKSGHTHSLTCICLNASYQKPLEIPEEILINKQNTEIVWKQKILKTCHQTTADCCNITLVTHKNYTTHY